MVDRRTFDTTGRSTASMGWTTAVTSFVATGDRATIAFQSDQTGSCGGATLDDALKQALDQRLRPILIAALTGVLGALPMAINPGPGAVIYRGLAAVSVGGVALSLAFTVVLVPALLRLTQSQPRATTAPGSASDATPLASA